MKILLKRDGFGENSTEGRLYVNGEFECFTLEDKDRKLELGGEKVQDRTAIPRGIYEVQISTSKRFKKEMPILLNVPKFTGIRIHSGNTSKDTEGCILVGAINNALDDDFIGASRVAFSRLFHKIKKAIIKGEKVTIEVA